MGTWVVVRSWNCGQTGGRIQQVRSDTGPIHSERPEEETLQRHGNLTIFDPDVTSSLLKGSNYPYFLCKPRVAKLLWNDLTQTITSYCVSFGFLRERLAISLLVMPHFPI